MKFSLYIFSFLVLAAVLACAAGDDLSALKTMLRKMCEANTAGAFRACCNSNNNGQDIKTVRSLPSCFGTASVNSYESIKTLFASDVILPHSWMNL